MRNYNMQDKLCLTLPVTAGYKLYQVEILDMAVCEDFCLKEGAVCLLYLAAPEAET